MNSTLKSFSFVGAILSLGGLPAATIFEDTFTGDTSDLNGKVPTTTTGGAAWVAAEVFDRDGSVSGGAGSATLAFTPSVGFIYTLDATITGITGTTNDWLAVGFANGGSSDSGASSRFINGNNPEGRAWMMARGTNANFPNRWFTAGNSNGPADDWAGPLVNANGGDLDFRIVLDTTGGTGNWTSAWFAKRPGDATYGEVGSSPLADESITSVGFAISNAGVSGTLSSFSLTSVPEPSSALLAGLGFLGLLRRRR